jgi:hypothetical protein
LPRPALGTGAFFNLREASTSDADGLTVLHEVNMAKVITAKEMVFTKDRVFNIGLFPFDLLIELILRAARTQRCAGEGELIFGLTNHDPMLPERGLGCQYAVFCGFGRLHLGLPEKSSRRAQFATPERNCSRASLRYHRT